MSAIRTRLQLEDALSADLAWRKKELHSIKSLVEKHRSDHTVRDVHVRSAVTLLYAHWEGFVKNAGENYLEFVGRQGLTNGQLSPPFLAMAASRLIRDAGVRRLISPCLDVVNFFRSQMGDKGELKWKAGISTKANLNSEVFRDIEVMLGLDYSFYRTKEKLLDEQLLYYRNNIAHGRFLILDADGYLALHGKIMAMIDDFNDQILSCATASTFRTNESKSTRSDALE